MRKIVVGLVLLTSLSSCFLHKKAKHKPSPNTVSKTQAHHNNEEIQKSAAKNGVTYTTYTSDSYILRFKAIAIQEMNTYGIPASITLAQGLFESASGNSDLARVANNHFGVKCGNGWTGKSYYKNDDQENDCFRVYSNPEESYRDHSNFLRKKNYAALFELDKNDYKGWAYGLKKAGYATNPNYPTLIINVIEKYHLDQYDRPEGEIQKIKREDRVFNQITTNMGKDIKDSIVNAAPTNKLYTVKQGDTLYNISKRYGLTIDELKTLNRIGDNNIKVGQQLVIAK
jgi:flagellum-specific peptidoglycan hydrolase FlgJ